MAVRSIRDIAVAARGRRQELGLSQAELARRAGVSRKWISEFETGKPTAELGLVLRVLDELGFRLDLHGESSTKSRRSRLHRSRHSPRAVPSSSRTAPPMSESLAVLLDDRVAGTLTRLPGGRLSFEYDDGYRERPDAVPLSLSMPVEVRSHADRIITPWLWGLLPDNEAVIARWAREFHVSASSPFSLLGTRIGEDCAGAVRFAPLGEVDRLLEQGGEVVWLSDDEVGERLRELRIDSTSWLGKSFTGQFSLAGAQAKTALLFEDGRWGVPSGATPTTHILKPAVAGLDDHDLNEHLCLDAAGRAGLIVVRTKVAHFASESAIVVDRYDRVTIGRADRPRPPGRPLPSTWGSAKQEVPKRGRTRTDANRRAVPAHHAISRRRRCRLAIRRRPRLELVDRRHRRARQELLTPSRRQRRSPSPAL